MVEKKFTLFNGIPSLVVSVVGFVVLFMGWILGNPLVVKVIPQATPMQFNAALLFFVIGSAGFLSARKYLKLSAALSTLVLVFASLTFFQYIWDFDFGIDQMFINAGQLTSSAFPGRMAPQTALCFILMSFSVITHNLTLRKYSLILGLLAETLVLALGLIALVGYMMNFDSAYGWGSYIKMAIHTATCFVVLAAGQLWESFHHLKRQERSEYIGSIKAGLIILFFTLSAWQFALQKEQGLVKDKINIQLVAMQREIHAELKQRAASMSRMAKRWSAQNRTSERLWRSDAITYLGDFAGYLNFTYVDSNFVNRWIEPKDKEKDFRDFDFKRSRRTHKNLDSTRRIEISKTNILPHGEMVFVKAHPVYSAAGHDGFIYTLVHYDEFFKSILDHKGFSVEISEDGNAIYKKGINELDIDMLRSWSAAIQVLVADDIVWNVSLIPSAAILREYSSNIPRFVLIIGCLLAIFISVIIHGNAELKKTREVAIASAASKAQFLANMSHEIRTPLNGVIGMAGLLQTTELSPIQNEYITYLKDSGHILLNLINDILDFSKIEAGKLQLENIDFNLEQNIDFVISNLSQAAENKKLKLRTEYAQPIPHWLVGDPSRFKQILINLVSNAIKFTSVGEVVVRTSILEQTDTHLNFKVSVTDTGIGILPESIEKLFQSFSQADSSIRRKFGGTGLGLAISQSLVHTMNGQIGVDSEIDKGSTFWFTLKLPVGKEVLDVEPESYIAPVSLTKRRILVAEDNTINQKVIDAILRKLGYECQVVGNGLEVLSLIENVKFDLILMDCQMPELDGLETTRLIRSGSNKLNKIIPIVALTANAMKGDRESCIAAGMNDYLTKPIVTSELAEVLNRLLKD